MQTKFKSLRLTAINVFANCCSRTIFGKKFRPPQIAVNFGNTVTFKLRSQHYFQHARQYNPHGNIVKQRANSNECYVNN